MLLGFGIFHKNFCHKAEEAVDNGVVETVVENIPEEPTVEEIPEAKVEEETSSKTKKSIGKNYGSVKNPVDKITDVTHKSSTEKPVVETTAGDVPADIKVVDNSKEEEDTKKAVEEAEKNGDKVTEMENGIIAIEKDEEKSEAEDKKDLEKVDIEDEKSKAEEIPSSENEEVVEEVKDNNECIEGTTDDELDNMLDSTTKTEEVKTEEKTEEPATGKTEVTDLTIKEEVQPVVPVKPVEKEEQQEVKPEVVEPVKEVKAVNVTAIDGYTTTVGNSIQFKIDGDDIKIEGLDGINYSFNGSVLTVNVGEEATVLSVCVSNSVNAVNFDIVVNGVLQ